MCEVWVGGVKSPKQRFCVTDGEDVMISCLTPKKLRDLKRKGELKRGYRSCERGCVTCDGVAYFCGSWKGCEV